MYLKFYRIWQDIWEPSSRKFNFLLSRDAGIHYSQILLIYAHSKMCLIFTGRDLERVKMLITVHHIHSATHCRRTSTLQISALTPCHGGMQFLLYDELGYVILLQFNWGARIAQLVFLLCCKLDDQGIGVWFPSRASRPTQPPIQWVQGVK
jgi:hypothetical protein